MTDENSYYTHIPVKDFDSLKERLTKLEQEVADLKNALAAQGQNQVHPWIIQPDEGF